MEVSREKNGNTCRRKHREGKQGKRETRCKMVGHPSSIERRDRDVLRKPGQKPIVRHAAGIVPATCHLPTPFQSRSQYVSVNRQCELNVRRNCIIDAKLHATCEIADNYFRTINRFSLAWNQFLISSFFIQNFQELQLCKNLKSNFSKKKILVVS